MPDPVSEHASDCGGRRAPGEVPRKASATSLQGQNILCEAKVEGAPSPEPRREHGNAGAIADFMVAVEVIRGAGSSSSPFRSNNPGSRERKVISLRRGFVASGPVTVSSDAIALSSSLSPPGRRRDVPGRRPPATLSGSPMLRCGRVRASSGANLYAGPRGLF